MGASQTHSEHKYQDLMSKTGFSLEQIKNLHNRFKQLSGNNETISRENLDSVPGLAYNPIRKQIIEAFFDKRNQHENEVGSFEEIGFEQFIMVMSHFRPPSLKTTLEEKEAMRKEKLCFLFNMHDTDNDGIITLEEYRKAPHEFYEGITFEHFEQILKGLEMESRMYIRFLDVDTTTMHCGKSTA
ncbi:tescalcin a isoform X3 [Mastacembelus armatus]|uniref:tescalcin a isoform X3 n=1 Tax=Mastacembelus armatus TaxID=205130 RepID=UPI000E45FC7C|nr:calcineurin B homologous protein 3 isoform X3 [Mastacembelus armatus]